MKALADQDPVFIQQRHHIRNGTQSYQGVFGQIRQWHVKHVAQGLDQFECDACTRQARGRVGGIMAFRVDNRLCLRQDVRALVMIGDNHSHTSCFQLCHGINAAHATVNGNQKTRMQSQGAFHTRLTETIAIDQPVRNQRFTSNAILAENRTSNAVAVRPSTS